LKTKTIYSIILEAVGVFLTFWAVARLAIHIWSYLRFPLPLDDGEGHVLNMAMIISQGKLPYLPINAPPYIVTNYPPLFPSITAIFLPFLNQVTILPGITVFPGLLVTRLISILSGLGIAFLIYKTCLRLKTGMESAIIVSFLFLAMPIIYFWFSIGKPDILAIFLGLLGFYIAIENHEKGGKIYFSLIPLVLALFTKQNEIAPFCAIFLFLILKRDKRWLAYLLTYAISIVFIAGILEMVTHGEFLRHVSTYTRTQFYFDRLEATWKFFAGYFLIPLAISFFVIAKSISKRAFNPAHFYFIFALLVSLTSGKVGSDMNYFIESIVAGHIILGIILGEWLTFKSSINEAINHEATYMRLAASALIFLLALDYAFIHDKRIYSYSPSQDDYQYGALIVQEIKNKPGMILSEDEGFAVVCRKEVMLNPFIMSELAKEGLWDQIDFVNLIKEKKFDLIILRFEVNDPNHPDKPTIGGYAGWDRWTDEMEQAIKENYQRYAIIPMRRSWYLYRPMK